MILLAIDLELNQPSQKIIEIGAAIGDTDSSAVLDSFSKLVTIDERVSPYITKLTGIKQHEIDKDGISLLNAFEELLAFKTKYEPFINPVVWGGNDVLFLTNQIKEQYNLDIKDFGRRVIDAKTVYVTYRISKKLQPSGGLAKAMTKFGLKFEGKKHRAKDDAINTLKIYFEMLRQMK